MTAPRRPLIVLLGGTFDPVHLGHVGAAQDVVRLTGCDALRMIPAAVSPHRDAPVASGVDRLEMLRCALVALAETRIVADDRELRRTPPSRTFDTVTELRSELGDEAALAWVVGSDVLAGFDRWYRWRELVDLTHLLVLPRPGVDPVVAPEVAEALRDREIDVTELRSRAAGGVCRLEQAPVEVSASRIRAALAGGAEVVPGLAPEVLACIRARGLYIRS